ncbi:MAG TPA: YbhB/YbcL family Raf kinase inhibitor-like protein [Alloacidobacterium sp.]|jgi:Raf kinase inhibitor-like YbhB/YbcL family protein|nr:YbhB/YbcL family Raf kinase inhibitor-like protein [Alloacidobacterium sp.]
MANLRRWGLRAFLLLLIVTFFATWLVVRRNQSRRDFVAAGAVPALTITSSSFADGSSIPAKFTCDGGDNSPQLSFSAPPSGTKSFLLVADDPDSPAGSFTHWVLFNLPPSLRDLPEGASRRADVLQGAVQGNNDFDKVGYIGPCPPGWSPHHYRFRVYALDTMLGFSQGATKEEVTQAAQGHVLAEGKWTGLYKRGR